MAAASTPAIAQRFSGWVAGQLLPLFTALGAAEPEARARAIHRGISDHMIAMDSYAFERD